MTEESGILSNCSGVEIPGNGTGTDCFPPQPLGSTAQISVVSMYVVFLLIGFTGTISTLVLIWRNKKFHNVTYYVIALNSSSDLVMMSVEYPIQIVVIIYQAWILGDFCCSMKRYLSQALMNMSALFVLTAAFCRFICITRPGLYTTLKQPRVFLGIIAGTVCYPLLVFLPSFFMADSEVRFSSVHMNCKFSEKIEKMINYIATGIIYIPCPFLTVLFYGLIYRKVLKSRNRIQSQSVNQAEERQGWKKGSYEYQLTRTTLGIFFMLAFTYIFPGIMRLFMRYISENTLVNVISAVIQRSGPVMNVLVYITVNKSMREGYLTLVRWKKADTSKGKRNMKNAPFPCGEENRVTAENKRDQVLEDDCSAALPNDAGVALETVSSRPVSYAPYGQDKETTDESAT